MPPRPTPTEPILDAARLDEFMHREFPQVSDRGFLIEQVAPMRVRVCMPHRPENLRPGGTISGPSLFTLADTAMYLAILAMIGPVALAVTTSTTVNFLRKPAPGDLIADAHLLKLGRRLAVGEVSIYAAASLASTHDGTPPPEDALVAHATLTYSIPPDRA